jgi:hypothetical protein
VSGTDPKTPAPKKDRVKGSKTNPVGSAASGKKSAVVFSKKTEQALTNKVKDHNEKSKEGRKATLGMLKAVYRRGAGAFSTSHRPGMTRDQWAMGRVNAFLKLLKSGKPANPSYTTDNDLLPAAHPRSSKSKNSIAITASVAFVPEERDLAEALLEVVAKHGKFNEDETGVWAGYTPPERNVVANIGVVCANCVFYQGGDQCQIIALPVEPLGKCRFAVIPDGVVSSDIINEYNKEKEETRGYVDIIRYADELSVEVPESQGDLTPEEAILALTEFSGFGYEAVVAFRASWLRGVRDGEDPYSRAKNLAQLGYNSVDADLLPVTEKGSFS